MHKKMLQYLQGKTVPAKMSTENLLRAQSAESLSKPGYSSSVYLRANSQQSRQRPQRKEGLDNPGFEGDFLEKSRREHSSSNSVLKRSSSVPQVMEGKHINGAERKQVNYTGRAEDGSSKKRGLQRQRPKTTSGQDLRRKAFINTFKLRRARSASYLVVPDEHYEDVVRENSVSQESSRSEANERSIRTPQNVDITKERSLPKTSESVQETEDNAHIREYSMRLSAALEERAQLTKTLHEGSKRTPHNSKITKDSSLQNLSESVQITEKENSHLREYSRRLSAALEERTQLTETLHALSQSVSSVGGKGRELPAHPEVRRSHSATKGRLLAENNTPHIRGNSFEGPAASASQENRRLPETPLHSMRGGGRRETNAQTERRQKLAEMPASAHCNETDKERKKRAVAKLAEDLWKCHIHGETFDTNDSPRGDTRVEDKNINGQATADWEEAGLLDQNEDNRTKLRRAAFRKQISFQDDEVSSALERRPGFELSRDYADEKGKSRYTNKESTTQLRETRSARSHSGKEELDRTALHQSLTEDLLCSQEHDVRCTTPLHQQPHPGDALDGYKLRRTQNSTSQRHQRDGKQEGPRDTGGEYPGDVDREDAKRENKLQRQVASHDYNGRSKPPLKIQNHLSSDSDTDHIGMHSRGDSCCDNGSFRESSDSHAHNTDHTKAAAPQLPSYDISLMTKRPSQGDGHHSYKTAELADAFMVTEDEEERRELQRQAANEAAILRREASNLLWKAMDLECICDQNARVRHVFIPH